MGDDRPGDLPAFGAGEARARRLGRRLPIPVPHAGHPGRSRELAKPLGLVAGISCALILVEPDLGTAIAIALMLGGMLVAAGTPFGLLARAGAVVVALGVAAIWLEPYRRERILSFFNPWNDAQGSGFQSVQAMIGLGSGGIFGEGIGEGITKIFYLPEAHTDMIFAVIGEELGLIGTAGVILAFAAFCWAGLRIAAMCPDRFGSLLATGLTVLDRRPGGDEPRRRARARSRDRNHAAVRLVRRLEPHRRARRSGNPP